jgi:hypothetical protein
MSDETANTGTTENTAATQNSAEASTPAAPASVGSASDERTINNVMRHGYRVLTDEEKVIMLRIKDLGLELHTLLAEIGQSRELSLAKTKVEEAVMWGVKHLTA